MDVSIDRIIADALRGYLEAQLDESQPSRRAFFRISGFDQSTYVALLDDLAKRNWRLRETRLEVRSIAAIPGHEERVLERGRSATWYRNHLAIGYALVLIQNRRSTDSQSLKDLYPVTETSLATDGLPYLIAATCTTYQLKPSELEEIKLFVRRFGQKLFKPQLRDLTEFLIYIDRWLAEHPAAPLPEGIARALPQLGLFRCLDIAQHLNTPQGDHLLRQVHNAARLGDEVLEEGKQERYLKQLETAELRDDSALNGYSAEEKRSLLRKFIEGNFRNDRSNMLRVLQIDWSEVQPILATKTRGSQEQRYQQLADELIEALPESITFDPDLAELLNYLHNGREPEVDLIDRVIETVGDSLSKQLRNKLRRLVKTRPRKHSDFLAGLTALAIELLYPRQEELRAGARLRVEFDLGALTDQKYLHEACATFRVLFGGIEQVFSTIEWNLEYIWNMSRKAETPESDEEDEEKIQIELPFRVMILHADGREIVRANLIWQYRSGSPAEATYRMLRAEREALEASGGRSLRIPVYKGGSRSENLSVLDIHCPLKSFGNFFDFPDSLRILFSDQVLRRFSPRAHAALFKALDSLEGAWGQFVRLASDQGLLAANIPSLLEAYSRFLHTAITYLQTGQEAALGFGALCQAWMVGSGAFEEWALIPLLHPLKLHWWYERARYFDSIVRQLLDPVQHVHIVDESRLQRELSTTYGSSQFPPILALPPKEGACAEWFIPIVEADGYELFVPFNRIGSLYSSDSMYLSDDELRNINRHTTDGIIAVIQDYLETYPFTRKGLEIVLLECRNSLLPKLLIENLAKSDHSMRISLLVHTSDGGAPLFHQVNEWAAIQGNNSGADHRLDEFFPMIGVSVHQGSLGDLLQNHTGKDLVILTDVLMQRGQRIKCQISSQLNDVPLEGFLPIYRAQQEPFEQGELYRRLQLTQVDQPTLVRYFLLSQYAASNQSKVDPGTTVHFYRELTLQDWQSDLEQLHRHFNWVICYDPAIDRFLLQATLPDSVQIIRYSLGLGSKRQHNLTVSSSHKPQVIVKRRLTARLKEMLPAADRILLDSIAGQLIEQAKQISGDIVLRAAGPGAFLNELIGIVAAKFETERRLRQRYPDALVTWILLDDFEHWFRGKFPDLLCIVIHQGENDTLNLHLEILEAKCVSASAFAEATRESEEQVRCGVSRLAAAFAPGAHHLDATFWYDQLYRAIAGNLMVDLDRQHLWELFRRQFQSGNFQQTVDAHAWVFCYDGQAGVQRGPEEIRSTRSIPDAPQTTLHIHRYGRTDLCRLLREMVEISGVSTVSEDRSSIQESVLYDDTHSATQSDTKVATVSSIQFTPSIDNSTSIDIPSPPPNPGTDAAGLSADEKEWLEQMARRLEYALRQRGVRVLNVNPSDADIGRSIVRFKVRLRSDETLRKVQGLADDLARDLELNSTPLIANVPGTPFIGVDIPRRNPEPVDLRPLLKRLPTPEPAELPIIIGVTPNDEVVIRDLAEFPHLLVAGATNSGKSVFLRSILLSLMTLYPPKRLEFVIIDPKRTDFTFFDQSPYLRGGKVIVDPLDAKNTLLDLAQNEMPRRQELMRGRSLKIKQFNRDFPNEELTPIVALIDEYHLLINQMDRRGREAFERELNMLAAAARSVGIHLVVATQRPSADVITPNLKANLGAQIAFRVATSINSRVVIDETGAEHLMGRGDMLFRSPEGELIRLQAPFMTEKELLDYLRSLDN